ncbi:MAG: DUF1080 domain-containing protein [Isosphaera sp.]|nr:DUF1080 domain-containing protein [Isosphaera sp.]
MSHTRRDFLVSTLATAAALRPGAAADPKPRSLFDGKTLKGWRAAPRLLVPPGKFEDTPPEKLCAEVEKFYADNPAQAHRVKNAGVWAVKDGAIVGGQVPDSQLGAYLISDDTFGDFDLTLETRPDWPIDTGVMVRAHALGSVGFQVLLDHRPDGAIGGVYGNGTGGFRAYPFVVTGDEQGGFKVAKLREGKPDGKFFKPDFAAAIDDFLRAWKPNEWNTLRVRCVGELPVIETWVNGTRIARLDTAKLADRVPGYDPKAVLKRIGRKGHIAFEVHDNGKLGRNRWAPDAVCRWRNITVTEL